MSIARIAAILTAVLAISSGHGPAEGQQANAGPDLEIGDRVRVATSSEVVVGTLRGRSSDGLLVLRGHRERFLPDSVIEEVEVAVGTAGSPATGALIGAGVGAGIGLLGGLSNTGDGFLELGTAEVMLVTVTAGAVGAGIGALIGLAVGGEEWVPVGGASAGVAVTPGGAAVGVRLPLGGAASR